MRRFYHWGRIALLLGGIVWASACQDAEDPAASSNPAADFVLEPGSQDPEEEEPQGPPPEPWEGPLHVVTYNVQLFFDTVCESGRCSLVDFEQSPSSSEFEARADEIADAIRAMNADVVLLQEVESEESLAALQTRLQDLYGVAVMGETGGGGSIDVAVLSKGRLSKVERHRHKVIPRPEGGTTRFAREFLEVHLDFYPHKAVVMAAHFKSKNNDDFSRRLAEAGAAREIVMGIVEENPEALVVLGGDLNDVPGSRALRALEEGDDLYRVASELEGREWTYNFRGEGVALDHLYLALKAGGKYIPGSSEVIRGEEGEGPGGSDHSALRASFQW